MFVVLALAISTATVSPTLPDLSANLTQVDYILPAQRVVRYDTAGELNVVSNVRLSPDAQTAYDQDFTTASYFGAFAVSKDGGWGYSTGTNSLEAARDIALNECLAVNSACTIHTEIVPQGYVDLGPGDVTLSPETAGHYNDTSTNAQFYAMAISADGAYSKVWGYPSQAEADTQALADCESYRVNDLPIGDYPCLLLPRAGKK
jgi:hypothetical protein